MDSPAKAAIGGTLITTLAIGGMVAVGVLATSAALVVSDPIAPPASADGLVRFQDCAALRDWYVGHSLDEVGPWGWGGGRMVPMMEKQDLARSAEVAPATTDGAVANGSTGTNTQEVDVDEPDVAKTDGRVVVRLVGGRHVVVTDVAGSAPREIADWRLPASAYAQDLLLVGDHVLLSSSDVVMMGREGGIWPGTGSDETTRVYDVDISDPSQPRLEDRMSWSGRQLSMRQYGDTVRLVTTLGLPSLKFVQPRPGVLNNHQAEQKNRAIVRTSSIEDWIPGLECGQVYHPEKWSGPETVAVTTFHPGGLADASRVGVAASGSEVYSSTDRLYVTSTDWPRGPIRMPMNDAVSSSVPIQPSGVVRTQVHAFALDGDTTSYLASGVVPGAVRDRWSLDEHDGHLRVAVSRSSRSGETLDNGVVVLDEHDGRLVQVGELHGLGTGEQIQSVRWFDDLAVVVTFRRMDPLYTIDLSDPTHPRQLGELKIPGFSAYLHPIGDDRFLGLGSDATTRGENLGAQAAVFDIADRTRARQLGKATFGRDTWFQAAEDPHAFTWLPDEQAAIAGMQSDLGDRTVLLHVAGDGSVTSRDLPSVGGWTTRALPLEDGRVALVGDRVKIVDVG